MNRGNILVAAVLVTVAATPCIAQEASQEELARKTQNPVSDLISLPLQNNTSFGIGPNNRTQNVLNIQPVIPLNAGKWNVINRPILPVVYQPDVLESEGGTFGLGDLTYQLFFSPAKPGKLIWGVGPVTIIPTATDDVLGSGKWSAGPAAIALIMHKQIVAGAIVFNAWSFAGDSDRGDVNQFLLQYFINFNIANGWYLVTAPIITANWELPSEDRWIVPFGAGVGKIFAVGRQPMNASVQGYWNAVKPDALDGPDWTLRTQLQFLFPK